PLRFVSCARNSAPVFRVQFLVIGVHGSEGTDDRQCNILSDGGVGFLVVRSPECPKASGEPTKRQKNNQNIPSCAFHLCLRGSSRNLDFGSARRLLTGDFYGLWEEASRSARITGKPEVSISGNIAANVPILAPVLPNCIGPAAVCVLRRRF